MTDEGSSNKSEKFEFMDSGMGNKKKQLVKMVSMEKNEFDNLGNNDIDDDYISDKDSKSKNSSFKEKLPMNKTVDKQKTQERKIVILNSPDGTENTDTVYVLSELPFFDNPPGPTDGNKANNSKENLISTGSNKNSKKKKSAQNHDNNIDLEASLYDGDSKELIQVVPGINTINQPKPKIRNEEALQFWKSKRHCIIFTKMTLSLLFSNIGLIILITFYIFFGAYVFQKIELTAELHKYQTYSNWVANKLNTSYATIVNIHEEILLKSKIESYENFVKILESQILKNKEHADKISTYAAVTKDYVQNTQITVIEKLKKSDLVCKTPFKNNSCESNNSKPTEEMQERIIENITDLNNSFTDIQEMMTNILLYLHDWHDLKNPSRSALWMNISNSTNNFEHSINSTIEDIIETVVEATKDGWNHNKLHFTDQKEPGMIVWTFGG